MTIPTTLYELAGMSASVPAEQVRSVALVEGALTGPAVAAAVEVLSDLDARADYDARASRGLAFELALAWGVAALSGGDASSARSSFERARGLAPDDRAVPMLLNALPAGDQAQPGPGDAGNAAARSEIARLSLNSAFPHRLIRYAAVLVGEDEASVGNPEAVSAARALLEQDILEAPRSYAMVLPLLSRHYPAVHALDPLFFDATAAVLAGHTPAAEYERGKRAYRETGGLPPVSADPRPDYDLSEIALPPLRLPRRRLFIPSLPRYGFACAGAVLGAIVCASRGPASMAAGAVIGFAVAYGAATLVMRR